VNDEGFTRIATDEGKRSQAEGEGKPLVGSSSLGTGSSWVAHTEGGPVPASTRSMG